MKLAILSALVLCFGCATDPSWPYTRENTSEEVRRADYAECSSHTQHLAWVSTAAAIADHVCMEHRGYSQVMWSR